MADEQEKLSWGKLGNIAEKQGDGFQLIVDHPDHYEVWGGASLYRRYANYLD